MDINVKKIYCIGGATIDRKLKILSEFQIATSNPVTSTTTFGGVARNVAENLSQWTAEIYLQSVFGDDVYGKEILMHLQSLNINTQYCITIKNQQTAHYYAVLNQDGELHNAFADMQIFDHVTHDLIAKSWEKNSIIFLDTNFPAHVIADLIQTHHDKVICIDPVSISKAKKLPANLENVFLIKPNQQEAEILTAIKINNLNDCKKSGLKLLERGVKNAVISLGKNGYMLINSEIQQHFPCQKIANICDVNGAGDAFVAGIIYGLQQGKELREACEQGTNAATLALQSYASVVRKQAS